MRITRPRLTRVGHAFDAFELARLLDHVAGFAALVHDFGNCNLALNRFAACFGVDGEGNAIDLRRALRLRLVQAG